jgi:hypothetical protein
MGCMICSFLIYNEQKNGYLTETVTFVSYMHEYIHDTYLWSLRIHKKKKKKKKEEEEKKSTS